MRLRFVASDGTVTPGEAWPGERLLDAAQRAGQPLEGTCGGAMACGTCLVTLDAKVAAMLPPASDDEEDMLDLLPGATRHGRLACQVRVTPALDGINVRLPASSGNSQRR